MFDPTGDSDCAHERELRQLFALVEGHWLEPIVKLAGALGLRRGEICGLRWDSVDFNLRKIHIKAARTAAGANIVLKETKNRSSNRVLHLNDDLLRLLKRERARQAQNRLALGEAWPDTGLVAVDDQGVPYSPNAVSLAFTRFIRKNGLPKITLHGLRHTFATRALECGMDVKTLSEILGHKNPTVTLNRYAHSLMEHKADMMNKLGKLL